MERVVRVYVLKRRDGIETVCVTDERNLVLFPEHDRDYALMEYGHGGDAVDGLDYQHNEALLDAGSKALPRPLKQPGSFDVWPHLDNVPVVRSAKLIDRQACESILQKCHTEADEHDTARARILQETEDAVRAFRDARLTEQQARLDELGPEPDFEAALTHEAGVAPCNRVPNPVEERAATPSPDPATCPDPPALTAKERFKRRTNRLGRQLAEWQKQKREKLAGQSGSP